VARVRSSNNTPERDSLLGAAILSAALHAAALFGAFVVWPYVAPPISLQADIVPVDLLTVADTTNISPQEKAEEPAPPEPQPVPVEIPPPQAPEFAAAEEPPPPPPDDDAPALEPEEKKTVEEPPKPEPQRYAMSSPRAKPKPEKPKEEFDINKILKSLDAGDKQPKETKQAPSKATAERTVRGAGAQTAMTASEIDALRSQLAKCWNVPVGAPDPAALVFRVRVFLNEDGTIASPPQLLDQGNLSDPYFRAAADSAIRAVHICGPYELPPEKYAAWNEIVIKFDPREMAGY
jgi:outer membrane biosynthesis protein TonB